MKSFRLFLGSILVVLGLAALHLALQAGPVPANKPTAYPAWWFEQDVIKRLPEVANKPDPVWPSDYPPADDYAAVNQGQVKHIAKQGYEEMKATLPGGAGSALDAVWATPAASTDDFRAINLGQLKAVAEPFYARLQALGYTGLPLAAGKTRPWTGTGADDYALANIGQVKNIFSFDLSGFAQTDAYLIILGGDQQTGPSGQVLPQALSVRVVDGQGLPVSNTTVSFSISGGAGTLSATTTSGTLTTLTVTTGITGQAVVYLKPQGVAGATTLAQASVYAQSLVFTAYVGGAVVSTSGSAVPPTIATPGSPAPGGTPLVDTSRATVFDPSAAQVASGDIQITAQGEDGYPDYPNLDYTKISISCSVTPGDADSWLVFKREDSGSWVLFQSQVALGVKVNDSGLLAGRLYEYKAQLYKNGQLSGSTPVVFYDVPLINVVESETMYRWGVNDDIYSEEYSTIRVGSRGLVVLSGSSYHVGLMDFFFTVSESAVLSWSVSLNPRAPGSSAAFVREKYESNWGWWNFDDDQSFTQSHFPGAKRQLADGSQPSTQLTASEKQQIESNLNSIQGAYSNCYHTVSLDFPFSVELDGSVPLLPVSLWKSGLKWGGRETIYINLSETTDLPTFLNWTQDGEMNDVVEVKIDRDGITTPLASGTQIESPYNTDGYVRITIKPKPGYTGSGKGFQMSISNGSVTTVIKSETDVAPSPGVNIPASESSGAKHRKIALNGAPLTDEKPQQAAESDQSPEETFVDALTLGLRHDTTDTYTAVPASDLALSVRRSASSEVWNAKNGLRPSERPDRPFGQGWSTNLAANIHFTKGVGTANEDGSNPDTATVTDENGASYTFAALYGASATYSNTGGYAGSVTYVPLPSSHHEQSIYLCSLTANANGTFTFKRKFGSTLTYSMTALAMGFAADRINGSSSGTNHTYARLDTVVDRFGNRLDYTYSQLNSQCYTLVPATISVHRADGTTGATLSIRQNEAGLITDIWDPLGHKIHYAYTAATDSFTPPSPGAPTITSAYSTLQTVTAADGQATTYGYEFTHEIDSNPSVTANVGTFSHLELSSITDPLQRTYSIGYTFDRSKYDYASTAPGDHYYVKTGLPRQVLTTTLPDGSTASFVNASYNLKVQHNVTSGADSMMAGYQRRSTVIDALGNQRDYDFTNVRVEALPSFATAYKNERKFDNPRMVYYQTMTITPYTGKDAAKVALGGTESFNFSPDAGMAVTSATDFSGNTTTYAYAEAFGSAQGSPYGGAGLATGVFGFYGDPTSQTNALNKTKRFTYGANRTMASSTDELGFVTTYQVDTLGRRLSETVTSASGTVPSKTTYAFKDSADAYLAPGVSYAAVSKNFLTKKTVKKLTSATDPTWVTDLVTVYVPDANSRVFKEIVDPSGLALTTSHTYDAAGNKLTTTDPRGNVTTFSYDARHRLIAVTNADSSQKQFFYDARGNKTQELDENGVATFWTYDALNRVTRQVVDMDGSLKTAYASTHALPATLVIDATKHLVTSTTYTALNARDTVTNPNCTVTKFEYDALQRLKKKTDDYSSPTTGHFNYATTYEYDRAKNPGGSVFDSSGFKPTQVTDPRGFRTQVTYDALYRPTEEKAEYQTNVFATTIKGYDDVGNLTQVTAPPATVNGVLQTTGTITKTLYDGLRRPTSVTQGFGATQTNGTSLAATTTTDYASTGFAWRTTDPLARITTTEYDAAGRPVKVFAPAVVDALTTVTTLVTPVTETRYDATGNVSYVINPLGRRTDYSYDARNRRVTEQQPAVLDATTGLVARPTRTTAYDLVGNVIAAQDARGFITTTAYDNARRPKQVTAPAVTLEDGTSVNPTTQSTYDSAGNVLTVTDANNHTVINTYDTLNRLKKTTDAAAIVVQNDYDAAGNRTDVYDGLNQRTRFAYDGLNRNTTVTDPALKAVTFTYDALNKTARVDSENRRTEYGYDARHRLETVTYVGRTADNRSYAYDLVGQLLAVTEPGKSGKADVAYTYDALGRQTSERSGSQLPAPSSQLTHTYGYDLANNRVTVTYGGTATVLTSAYDELNRLSTLTELPAQSSQLQARVTTYGYDLNGNRVLQQMPNGETVSTQFDPLNRQAAQTTSKGSSGSLLLQLNQGYDAVGNVKKVTERYFGSTLAPRIVSNTYDAINRLVGETIAQGVTTTATVYAFDAAHNRTTKAVSTTTGTTSSNASTVYSYNNLNQLKTATTGTAVGTYSYDLNGNRQTLSFVGSPNAPPLVDTYGYDYENRLVSLTKATTGGSGSYAYVYDYRTRRVERTENGTTTQAVFSGGVSVQEYAGGGLSAEYVRGSDWGGGVGGLLYSLRSGVPLFDHYNSRGDLITQTNAAGAATWQASYEAFGTRTQEVGSTQDRQKANTKEEDPTGLLNEGFRYRDLATGSFITRDPLGFVDGPNMYAYVVQNPWSLFDPEGLKYEYDRKEDKKDDTHEQKKANAEYNAKLDTIKQEHDKIRENKDYYKEGSAVYDIDKDDKNIVKVRIGSDAYGRGERTEKDGVVTTVIYLNPSESQRNISDRNGGTTEATLGERFAHESRHAIDHIQHKNWFENAGSSLAEWRNVTRGNNDLFVRFPNIIEQRAVNEQNALAGREARVMYDTPENIGKNYWGPRNWGILGSETRWGMHLDETRKKGRK